MDDFYIVTMLTASERTLYLKSGIGSSCEWTFDRQECIWFETYTEAEKFAKRYFKNFTNYEITTIYEKIYV